MLSGKLSFWETLGVALGTTVGGGLFALTVPAAKEAGAGLPWAFVLGALPAACALLPVAALAAALPCEGGNYKYPARILSPKLAFLSIWVFAMGAFFGIFPLYALTCVEYARLYFPSLPAAPAAAVLLTFFWLINAAGVRLAAAVEGALVLVLLTALIAYAALGVPHVQPAHLQAPWPKGVTGLVSAGSLLTFAYVGSNALIELGQQIERPERNIPWAMGICLLLVMGLYVTVGYVTVGAAPPRALVDGDLTAAASRFLSGPGLMFFVIGGALLALGTSLNACFLWGTKSLEVLCKEGFLPAAWGRIHPRFGTPYRILTGVWALSIVGLFAGFEKETMNAFATLGGLFSLIPVQLSAMMLPRRMPGALARSKLKLPKAALIIAPIVGVLLCVGAMATLLMELVSKAGLVLLVIWFVVGVLHLTRVQRSIKHPREPGWS